MIIYSHVLARNRARRAFEPATASALDCLNLDKPFKASWLMRLTLPPSHPQRRIDQRSALISKSSLPVSEAMNPCARKKADPKEHFTPKLGRNEAAGGQGFSTGARRRNAGAERQHEERQGIGSWAGWASGL